jgi:hypothetical protein
MIYFIKILLASVLIMLYFIVVFHIIFLGDTRNETGRRPTGRVGESN